MRLTSRSPTLRACIDTSIGPLDEGLDGVFRRYGHVEGILRMLEVESVYCVDALKQIKAVDGALDKVGELILRSHLRNHVVTAHERGDEGAIVEELMEALKYR